MDDPCAVRALERVGDLDPVAQHSFERQRAAREPVGERLAFEVLHDQVVDAVLLADVVERADVRMAERGDRLRLALEAEAELRVAGEVRRQHLDRDGAVEARVARAVDLAHAARAERETISYGPRRVPGERGMDGATMIRPLAIATSAFRTHIHP